jgi:hydroxymethylglutaryl-CoA lyase
MSDLVKIIECPRDAWQGLPLHIPAEVKADYLRLLIAAGFKHIDAVSFVSAAAVPQMADSEKTLEYLDPPDDVELIGIVVNPKGAERAIKTDAVQTLGFPYSISPGFLQRNQNQTPEESLEALEQVGTLAYKAGLDVVAYISMAFGNVMAVHDGIEIGVHLHARYEGARELVRAAYNAGCRRFDAAMGGLGGCPFAQDVLVGNLPTEMVLEELRSLGAELPPLSPLDSLQAASAEIARKYGAKVQ